VARFCQACATPLTVSPPQERRKTVTILFTDLVGSTSLSEGLDPEAMRAVVGRYFDEMRTVVERHGGAIEKFVGDAVMAIFGLPRAHEDDALRAVRAALDMEQALRDLNKDLAAGSGVSLANRTGINTGEVVVGDASSGQRLATGDAVNVAARLEQSAGSGEILVGHDTYRLVRDAVIVEAIPDLKLKGKARPTPAFRLIDVTGDAEGVARRLDTPLVGRTTESDAVERCFDRALSTSSCELVMVLGEAGIGKTRFTRALTETLAIRAHTLTGSCLPYGESITFWPVAEVVRQMGDIPRDVASGSVGRDTDLVADRLAALTGLSERTFPLEETYWAVRKSLQAIAAQRPVVVTFEDIHRGEPAFLDLIGYLARSLRGVPVLLICTARREWLDEVPQWARDGGRVTTIALDPLPPPQVEELLDHLLGDLEAEAAARASVLRRAQGNPLFVEQLVSMGTEDGSLFSSPGRPADESSSLEQVPTTLSGVLAARLDRLTSAERALIGAASVVGDAFSTEAVRTLCSGELRERVDDVLQALAAKEFLGPGPEGQEKDSFSFRHVLIRDAAYRSVLKRTRSELHEAFAEWLSAKSHEHTGDYEDVVGFHLEQAVLYNQELRPVDEHTRDLALRAARLLASAGRRATARGDVRSTVDLLQRARTLFAGNSEGTEILPDLGQALWNAGALQEAADVLEKASASDDERVEARAVVVRAVTDDGYTDGLSKVQATIPLFRRLGDSAGLASALLVTGTILQWQGRLVDSAKILEEAIDLEESAGYRNTLVPSKVWLAWALMDGPTPVVDCLRRLQRFVDEGDDFSARAFLLGNIGQLKAMLGEFDLARSLQSRSREMLRDLGHDLIVGASVMISGTIEMLAGDPLRAEQELRQGYDALDALEDKGFLCTVAGYLAEALLALDRFDEALLFTDIAEKTMEHEDDVSTQILFRKARAEILARQGDLEAGERLARSAVAISERTQFVGLRGDALMSLGHVLRTRGEADGARSAVLDALRLYERKGNLVSAMKARRVLDGL
jgi:class 3 adenylate cyclase/tetratricopeptide (TPR) repeat protein